MTENNSKAWALVLGGSSGLGLATAKKLASEGFNLIVVHRDRAVDIEIITSNFQEITSKGVTLKSYNIDATNKVKRAALIAELKSFISDTGGIAVLVHSIAKGNLKAMRSDTETVLGNQDFQLTIDAMAISLYDWVQELHLAQLFAADARVISFTSEGNNRAWANYAAVSAAKAALEAITRNIALEFAAAGIKANCIQAGITETPSFKRIPGNDLLKENALVRNPNGRLTRPEDIANATFLLTTQEAKWITGTTIVVDGGESLS